MKIVSFNDGVVVHGTFPNPELCRYLAKFGPYPLIIADPPYGKIVYDTWDHVDCDDKVFAEWMLGWTRILGDMALPGGAMYVWGGIGRPNFRPFYRYLSDVENDTPWQLANHITWAKKRAYGVAHNYLFTREELAYLCLGDIKKPHRFNIPLLPELRGYAGYNAKYPAKSEYLRRTNVWSDVTEILKGKVHTAQKPQRLCEIPIEIHTEPNDWVLDPFAGSGTTALAARHLGRRFVVVEADEGHFELICSRLR